MATLVQFLAAGVNGAANGSATFLQRGTVTSAAAFLYNDFERTAQPGTHVITLDANGAAEVYCSVYVDVTIRNAAGTILRTVTLANSDSLVEVRSDSFTGTDYDGDPADTAGEPVTLRDVLDAWLASAGAADWKVLVNGSPSNISSAFSAFTGIFINVKDPQYGATGDGSTNDTVAITNAMAAAASIGGVVVFPPGTYVLSEITIPASNFCLLGFGQATIRLSTGQYAFTVGSSDNTVQIIQGLKFEAAATSEGFIHFAGNNQAVTLDGCVFNADQVTDDILLFTGAGGILNITNCRFTLSTTLTEPALNHFGGDGKTVNIDRCHFVLPEDYVGTVIRGSCFNINNSVFDGSLVTAAGYTVINPVDPIDGTFHYGFVRGCEFSNGGASAVIFRLDDVGPGSHFLERDNVFLSITSPYSHENNATLDDTAVIAYGSREGAQFGLSNASFSTLTISAPLQYDRFVVTHTNASNLTLTFTGTDRPVGLSWEAVVLNNSGGARDIVFGGTGQSVTVAAVADGGRAMAHFFTYLETTGTVAVGVTGTGIAAT